MHKITRSAVALATVVVMVMAWAANASANLAAPTPNNGTVQGTVTLFDDGSNSAGINLLITSCNGSTSISVKNSANQVLAGVGGSVSGSGGQGAPIPLTSTWVTDHFPNGVYTVTGSDVKKTSICLSSSTTTTTRTLTVSNNGTLAYGGDTSAPTGGTATVKATLTDQNGIAPPAGQTVSFALSGGNTVNAATDASGVAQTTIAVTGAPRAATLTVSYAGAYYNATSVPQAFTVTADPTTTTVASSANPSTFGLPVHFTATVGSNVAGTGTPTGSVQFSVDGTNLGGPVTLVSGSATSPSTSALTAGSHPVLATYTATGNFANSSGSLAQVVNKATTAIAVTGNPTSTVFGEPVTFTANVSVTQGAGVPTGTVTFQQNGSPIGGAVTLQPDGSAVSDPIAVLGASSTPYTITATYQGDTNFAGSSTTSSHTVSKADTSAGVTSSANPSVFGQSVSFTTTVTANPPGAGTPTGNVTFTVDGNALGGSVALSSSGQATSTALADLAPGDHSIVVSYAGDDNFNPTSQTISQHVDQAQTTTSLSSSANPSVFGQPVTFSSSVAVVTPGAGTPAGNVTFTVDGNPLGSPVDVDSAGNASSPSIADLTVGPHTVVATYSGDTNFVGSTQTITETVNRAATSTTVDSSVNPSVFGQLVQFTGTVSVTAPGAGSPSGTITFTDGSTVLATVPVASSPGSATASFSTTALSVGTHAVTATYDGDGNFLTSSGSVTQTTNQAQSATTVVQNGGSVQGQPVTFNASVGAVAPGAGIPTGSVRFFLNGAPQGSPVALDSSGQAVSAPIAGLTPGSFTITATYSGDTNFLTSGGSVGQAVGPAATTTSLQSSPNPSAYGAPVTLTATVAPVAPGTGSPTGTVDFFDGTTLIGTGTLSGGSTSTASFTTSTIAVGGHAFTASYLGEADFATSTSGTVTQTVQGDPTTTALAAAPNPSVFNSPITLTATITPTLANPNSAGGTVAFFDGSTLLGTSPVVAGGSGRVASLSVSTLAVGSHSLKAVYSGDSVFGSSTSAVVTQTVNKEPTTLTKSSVNQTTLIAHLSTAQGPLAGQTVTFKTGSTTICVLTTDATGSATCAAGSNGLSVILHGFTVSYAGNASYLPSNA